MNRFSENYTPLLEKLKNFRRKELNILVLENFLFFLIFFFISVLLLTFLESLFYFPSGLRTPLFFLYWISALIALSLKVLYPLSRKYSPFTPSVVESAAQKVGTLFSGIKDELLNHIQLFAAYTSRSNLYSENLIKASFDRFYNKTEKIDFLEPLTFSKPKKILPYTLIIITVSILLMGFIPDFNSALGRLYNYDQDFETPPRFKFTITPGNISVPKNQNVTIKVNVSGNNPSNVILLYKDDTQNNFASAPLSRDSLGNYQITFSNLRNSFTYYAKADELESDHYQITVIDRPIIKNLTLKILPPAYSRIQSSQQIDNGNFEALMGSNVSFSLIASKELKETYLLINDSLKSYFAINSNLAEYSFIIKNSFNYKIILRDLNGNLNLYPVEYQAKIIYDAPPVIGVLQPNADVNISADERIPLVLKIEDDFGFSKLNLAYRLSGSVYEKPSEEYTVIEIPVNKSLKEETINYIWNLTGLSLATEDVVSYYLEIFDNDLVSGPKSAKSPLFRLRMPSLAELFSDTEKSESLVEKELKEALNQAQDLKKDIEKLSNDLRQDKKELTWDEKENLRKTAESFEKLNQKIEDISQTLEENRKKMQDNDLLSMETLEKYMQLQELLDELSDEDMKTALKKMNEQLQNLMRQQAQQQLENMKFDEEMFRKSIERTLNLFKRIQTERKLDELVKRTEDLIEKQEEIKEKLSNQNLENKNERDKLTKQQEQVSDELKNLNKELDKLREKMQELKDLPNNEMSELDKEFDKQNNDELSEQAKENMQQMQKQQAMNNQSQISKNLSKLKQSLQNMQNMMQQQNQMKAFADMVKILDDLITLSKEQEKLRDNTRQNWKNSSSSENAAKQSGLKDNLERLLNRMNQLSQKTFAITPEMGKALGDARKDMNSALESLQNKNSSTASASQSGAMKNLNSAASLMKGMMDQMMQGGQGGQGGMMSLMQQMQQLSQQQMSLNQMSQMLQQGLQGQLTPQQQAQMQRLAQQQELVRKSLEQLNQEARESGRSKSMLSNIDETLKQMQEVITDMKTDKLNDEVIQKQERILSKLLDAQKSVNERDYEKQRESKTTNRHNPNSPDQLNLNRLNRDEILRNLINSSGKEGFSPDYEQLIKKYYQLLQNNLF